MSGRKAKMSGQMQPASENTGLDSLTKTVQNTGRTVQNTQHPESKILRNISL